MTASDESWFEVQLAGLADAVEDSALVDQAVTVLGGLHGCVEAAEKHPELVESLTLSQRRFLVRWLDDQIETLGFLLEEVRRSAAPLPHPLSRSAPVAVVRVRRGVAARCRWVTSAGSTA